MGEDGSHGGVDLLRLGRFTEAVTLGGLGDLASVRHRRGRQRTPVMRDEPRLEVRLEPAQRRVHGIDARVAGHLPGDEDLRTVELVPRLDLRLPRHLIAEARIAVGAHHLEAAVDLLHGRVDLVPGDLAAPLARVPHGRTVVWSVAGSEYQALARLALEDREVVILATVHAQGDRRAVRRIRQPDPRSVHPTPLPAATRQHPAPSGSRRTAQPASDRA